MNGVQPRTMKKALTKEQQLANRRARVKQLIADGRVMNDSMRKKIKEVAKRQQELEDAAELILVGISPNRNKKDVTEVKVKSVAPEANVNLKAKVKFDTLASQADAILKELQGV